MKQNTKTHRMKYCISFFLMIYGLTSIAQNNSQAYIDSLKDYRNNYIQSHEVVKGNDKQFLHFYPINPAYRVSCKVDRITNGKWFQMSASGKEKQIYRKYGRLTFAIHDTILHLYVYQSQSLMTNNEYKDYLFIPFTDNGSGNDSYGGGRYLECFISDIKNNQLILDFNKAYNPYCAYTTGYNCPIPPRENDLPILIGAGEKNYGKPH
jgi:uncharacterized protein (DUF1684 family)